MSCQCNAVRAVIQLCRGFSGAQIRSIWARFADGVKGQEMSTRRDWRTDLVFQVGRQRTKRINLWNKYLLTYLSTSLNKCKYNICMSLTLVCHFTCISYSDPHTDPMSLRIEGRSIFTLQLRKIKPRTVTWPAQGRWGKKMHFKKARSKPQDSWLPDQLSLWCSPLCHYPAHLPYHHEQNSNYWTFRHRMCN